MQKTLYICYFGVREPLVQTQVIPYLRELKKDGYEISLLTFESRPFTSEEAADAAISACAALNIRVAAVVVNGGGEIVSYEDDGRPSDADVLKLQIHIDQKRRIGRAPDRES